MKNRLQLLLFLCLVSCCIGCDDNTSSPDTDIVFDAEFDSGNMEVSRYLGGSRFLVRPRAEYGIGGVTGGGKVDVDWNGRTWWYHFSITVPEEDLPYPIALEIDASRVWVGRMYAADKVPVVSCDRKNWRFVDSWLSWNVGERTSGNPVIKETLTCPTTYVAMATPYSWGQMETYLASIDTSPYILRHDIIGHTPEGDNGDALPLYYLLLSDSDAPSDKRNVVVISGQHPGETANSWMLTGFMEFLLSDDALAHSLRQAFAFHIYPMVNPEGVKYGHYRRSPESRIDTNRGWSSSEVREVEIVRDHILAQTNNLADYFFDLHGTSRSYPFMYHCGENQRAREFVTAVAARHPAINADHGQSASDPGTSARQWALHHLYAHGNSQEPPLSFVLEASCAQGGWEGAPDQRSDWKAMGIALVQSIGDLGLAQK